MTLQIVSKNGDSNNRPYRTHRLDGIDTIGVFDGDAFGVRYRNTSGVRQAVRLSVDGTNVLTGQRAKSGYYEDKNFIVEPHGTLELDAWAETTEHGARFVFTGESNAVAVHTHGDVTAIGYISALVWSETYVPPPRFNALESFGPASYGGGLRSKGLGDNVRGGSAVGAGETISQHIGTTTGLTQPGSPRLLQVRHLWWDDLAARVPNLAGTTSGHPTGFVGTPLANLGSTPRPGQPAITLTIPVTSHPRFN